MIHAVSKKQEYNEISFFSNVKIMDTNNMYWYGYI